MYSNAKWVPFTGVDWGSAVTIWEQMGWDPGVNDKQRKLAEAFCNDGALRIIICGGERSGKSMTAAAMLAAAISDRQLSRDRTYWIVGPDYYQARAEFQYIYDAFRKVPNAIKRVSMGSSRADAWILELGEPFCAKIETKSSYDLSKLASFTVDGCLVVETNQQDVGTMRKIEGRLSETRGWMIASGTLEEANPWYAEKVKEWMVPGAEGICVSIPTWENSAIYPGGWADPAIKRLRGAGFKGDQVNVDLKHPTLSAYFLERYAAIPMPSSLMVIPEFNREVHLVDCEPDPGPMELWVDPGSNVYAVAFVQPSDGRTVVYDCIYEVGSIAQDVIPKVMQHPLWEYVEDNTNPTIGWIDQIAKTRSGTYSQLDIWWDIARVRFAMGYCWLKDSIETVRWRLQNQRLYFHADMPFAQTDKGMALEAMSEFDCWKKRRFSTRLGDENVVPDNNNHFIKALAYGLLGHFGPVNDQKRRTQSRKGKRHDTDNRHDRPSYQRNREREPEVENGRRPMAKNVGPGLLVQRRIKRPGHNQRY